MFVLYVLSEILSSESDHFYSTRNKKPNLAQTSLLLTVCMSESSDMHTWTAVHVLSLIQAMGVDKVRLQANRWPH